MLVVVDTTCIKRPRENRTIRYDPDDYHWLVGPEAAPWLAELSGSHRPVEHVARLRRHLSAERTHLVVEQVELRSRAVAKFARAGQMFFTRVGLEQATDEVVARHKAARFAPAATADLCCGIGGDLLALAGRGPTVGIDRDPIACLLADANLRACGIEPSVARLITGEVSVEMLDACGAWHIDPDRRPQGRRTTQTALHEPGPATIAALLAHAPAGAVKLAPAAEFDEPWWLEAELEWIASRGECRQLVAWFGPLARHAGRRVATIVSTSGLARTLIESDCEPASIAANIGRYVCEPDPAVLAAELLDTLASEHGLERVAARVAYLTGDHAPDEPALDAFEVLEVFPCDLKRLKVAARARGWGRVEVKKRGVELDPAHVAKQLRGPGKNTGTVILTPTERGVVAVLARRVAKA